MFGIHTHRPYAKMLQEGKTIMQRKIDQTFSYGSLNVVLAIEQHPTPALDPIEDTDFDQIFKVVTEHVNNAVFPELTGLIKALGLETDRGGTTKFHADTPTMELLGYQCFLRISADLQVELETKFVEAIVTGALVPPVFKALSQLIADDARGQRMAMYKYDELIAERLREQIATGDDSAIRGLGLVLGDFSGHPLSGFGHRR